MDKIIKRKKPKNRLYKGSKYSEFKIEKVIRCFADDLTVQETAEKTKISIRSLRPIYRKLRLRLFSAAKTNVTVLGYSGMFLNVLRKNDLEMLRNSVRFQERMKKYFPRAVKPNELTHGDIDSVEVTLLLMEIIIRDMSQTEMVKDDDFDLRMVKILKYVESSGFGNYLDWQEKGADLESLRKDKVMDFAIGMYEQIGSIMGQMIRMEFDMLIGQSRKRPYSGHVIFRDLKKYILKNPL